MEKDSLEEKPISAEACLNWAKKQISLHHIKKEELYNLVSDPTQKDLFVQMQTLKGENLVEFWQGLTPLQKVDLILKEACVLKNKKV